MPRPRHSLEEIERFKTEVCIAALKLIGSGGITSLTFRALANELGSSHTRVHRYFQDREAIVDAVREYAFGQFAGHIGLDIREFASPVDALDSIVDGYLSFAQKEPDCFGVLFNKVSDPWLLRSPNRHAVWEAIRQPISHCVNEGYLEGDVDLLTNVVWSAIHGMTTLILTGNVNAQSQQVKQLLFNGLMKGHAGRSDYLAST